MKKKIGIVTVSFNGAEDSLALLSSAKILETEKFEVKWVLVDNGSTDGIASKVSQLFPEVDVVPTGENLGFTGGYNRGMRYLYAWGADFVLIINNDTLIKDKNFLNELVSVLESNEKIGLVSPKILFAPGYEYFKDRYTKKDEGKVIWYAGANFDWNNLTSIHRGIDEVDLGNFNQIEETKFVSGCCWLMRREVLSSVGYFDDSLFAYFEDNDYLVRAEKVGWQFYYNGKTSLFHKVSRTAGIGSSIADYYLSRNKLTFSFRYARLRTQIAVLKEGIRLLFSGRPLQKKGITDFFKGKKGIMERVVPEKADWPIKLSVAIVNYKTLPLTMELLESLSKGNQNMEIVILDNASQDNIEVEIKKKFPQVKFVSSLINLGFSGGYNLAMDYCRGKYLLMLNSDIVVRKGSLEKLLKSEEEYGGNIVVSGKLILPDETTQKSAYHLPTALGAIREYFLGEKDAFFSYLPDQNKPSDIEGVVMACFLLPQMVRNEIGRLDEGTKFYFEDIDYCRRLKQANIPIYYVPEAVFDHHHGASARMLEEGESVKRLEVASLHYHGTLKYYLITAILWIGQKIKNAREN